MEIKEVSISKIRPDPDQPRKSFDDEHIEGMAQSIKSTGIINPVEIDANFVIITGEQRWRAAKKAGLKTIPTKMVEVNKNERFMRQVIENIHHHTMSDWDTANAFKKLLAMRDPSYARGKQLERKGHYPIEGKTGEKGIRWLSEKTGKSTSYVVGKLALFEMSEPVKKRLKEGSLDGTYARIIERSPEPFKKQMEKKLLRGEFKTSLGGLEVAAALNRTPALAKEILSKDYSKFKSAAEVGEVVGKISPRVTDLLIEAIKPTEELGKLITHLLKWLDTNTPQSIGQFNIKRVIIDLTTVEKEIKKWLQK